MISGNIHEKSNLAVLPEPLQRAVQFLKDNDLAAHEPGKFELDGDKMILQVIDQSTGPRENLRPECHRKYIDVQFLAAGAPSASAGILTWAITRWTRTCWTPRGTSASTRITRTPAKVSSRCSPAAMPCSSLGMYTSRPSR